MRTLLLVLPLVLTPAASAQDNVTFVHGLNGDADSWSEAASYLGVHYWINSQRIEYSSAPTISDIADNQYPSILDSTIIVAHSMGGLVSREMVRTHSDGKIRAMVTVGTPHTGAAGAEIPGTNRAALLLLRWVNDLVAPWILLIDSDAVVIALGYINLIFGDLVQTLTDKIFGGQSVQDMRSTSDFLQTLNASPERTFPAAYYTLWSTEDWNMQYRLFDARVDGVEDGTVMLLASQVQGVYLAGYFISKVRANDHCYRWMDEGDLDSLDQCVYWTAVAFAFLDGVYAIGWRWQYDWNRVVVGTSITSLDSDGIVRTSSQSPDFVPLERMSLIPGGINHFEQRTHQFALETLADALRKPDIAISGHPLRVSISGPSILSVGEIGTWTAMPSKGKPPYTYDWDYQLVCSGEAASGSGVQPSDIPCDAWQDGGARATLSLRVSSIVDELWLRLTVTDAEDDTKTAQKTVYIN